MDPGSFTYSLSLSLPIHVSYTAATSQDGSIFRMRGSEGGGFEDLEIWRKMMS